MQPWEGLFGDDSFGPYQAGDTWYGFYGSAHTEGTWNSPYSGQLTVGLVSATSKDGPWTRLSGNPLNVESQAWVNPIVYRCTNGAFLAVYDPPGWPTFNIGYTTSVDGIHWSTGKSMLVQTQGAGHWAATLRTPLGVIPEDDGTFTIFYTAATGLDLWSDFYHMALG